LASGTEPTLEAKQETAVQPKVTSLPAYFGTPTPDPPQTTDGGQTASRHFVSPGETLGYIAQLYGTSLEALMTANELSAADFLSIGQELIIPNVASQVGPNFKIIPDSELVYGPAAKGFRVQEFAATFNGYLMSYREDVEGVSLSGPEIVELVAHRYSVNPRLLLAALEYRSGWVTQGLGTGAVDDGFSMRQPETVLMGLYRQLSWAADELNWGYYGRAEGGVTSIGIGDGSRVAFAPDINHGTAGVQNLLGKHNGSTYQSWLQDIGPDGLYATYNRLFGNPFAYSVDPLWPQTITQPPLQLPWAVGETWYLTGGPHGGWDVGSAWAALDFVQSGEQLGCVQTDAWVTAMGNGIVTRSSFGAVVVDMDGDNYAGTGWSVLYMHLESRDRIAVGTPVQMGDRLGHPSCEGGFSNGTHVHVARLYNGRWVSADGLYPFKMGAWEAQGLGREYDGLLVRGDEVKEACECREETNALTRDE
jgi:murein DD-endopeptidase MepM/ murein hydrolase activator NlpD